MSDSKAPLDSEGYPHGRGYGHDYMRGGEVLGGYGYSERVEYELPLAERDDFGEPPAQSTPPQPS